MEKKEAIYDYIEEKHGKGMYFYTSCCGNIMYSVQNDPMLYHGCLCPKCSWNIHKLVTLYLRGTPEGIRVIGQMQRQLEIELSLEVEPQESEDKK